MRTKIKFEWPDSLSIEICADAGNAEQAEFVDASSESHRKPVTLSIRSRPSLAVVWNGGRAVEIAIIPGYDGTCLIPGAPGRIVGLKPDWTIETEFETIWRNLEFFL